MFLWYIIGFFLALIMACEYSSFKTGVPTVTSLPSVRRKMVEILRQEAKKSPPNKPFTILDLGSGTGKLALEIAKALPTANVTGLEISPVPFYLSLLRRFLWRVKNVAYKREDFWLHDLSAVDAVTLYMNGKIRDRMAQKLKAELPAGTLVISNETHLPGWTPLETHTLGLLKVKLVVYRQS